MALEAQETRYPVSAGYDGYYLQVRYSDGSEEQYTGTLLLTGERSTFGPGEVYRTSDVGFNYEEAGYTVGFAMGSSF